MDVGAGVAELGVLVVDVVTVGFGCLCGVVATASIAADAGGFDDDVAVATVFVLLIVDDINGAALLPTNCDHAVAGLFMLLLPMGVGDGDNVLAVVGSMAGRDAMDGSMLMTLILSLFSPSLCVTNLCRVDTDDT